VNESIPVFDDLLRTFVEHSRGLRVALHIDTPAQSTAFDRVRGPVLRASACPLSVRAKLVASGGSIAMRATVRRSLRLERRVQGPAVLRAGDYAGVLGDYRAAVETLLPLLPPELVDRPFPGEKQTKFELLNGWRKPQLDASVRIGFRRARWFLTRPDGVTSLQFDVSPLSGTSGPTMKVRLGDAIAASARLDTGSWTHVSVPLAAVAAGARFTCELELGVDGVAEAGFDDYCFAVRSRRFE
jgi:hypothetical protein